MVFLLKTTHINKMFSRRETIEIPTFDRLVLLMCYVFCSVALHCIAQHCVHCSLSNEQHFTCIHYISNCIIKSDWGKKTPQLWHQLPDFLSVAIGCNQCTHFHLFEHFDCSKSCLVSH